ncbi:MAG: DUF2911 domain-containing protein, partial [Cyclobacteriaceae bacterium]|nr:DUF2911 domain-containing protein [Cyclobacteriaceae bacterium]
MKQKLNISALLTLLLAFISSYVVAQQISTPAASPGSKTEQAIGLVNATIEYSRPSMKGRKIFGDLVPFDQVWRTGANSATKLTIDG